MDITTPTPKPTTATTPQNPNPLMWGDSGIARHRVSDSDTAPSVTTAVCLLLVLVGTTVALAGVVLLMGSA